MQCARCIVDLLRAVKQAHAKPPPLWPRSMQNNLTASSGLQGARTLLWRKVAFKKKTNLLGPNKRVDEEKGFKGEECLPSGRTSERWFFGGSLGKKTPLKMVESFLAHNTSLSGKNSCQTQKKNSTPQLQIHMNFFPATISQVHQADNWAAPFGFGFCSSAGKATPSFRV